MRIPRIFHPELLTADTTIQLTDDGFNHLIKVLRLSSGHPIVLFNGDGNEYSAEVAEVSKKQATALVSAKLSISVESPLPIHLGQVVSRGDRMEFVLQKSVELGVSEITPLLSERCGVKLANERWQKKHHQWQKIIIGACEQCGRNQLPTLHPVLPLDEWLTQNTQALRLTLHPHAEQRFNQINLPPQGAKLLIGPEGGFSEQEVYQTQEMGFQAVKLGPRVLRTETAALAAITALQAVHGDL